MTIAEWITAISGKIAEIKSQIPFVYDSGYTMGHHVGSNEGYTDGLNEKENELNEHLLEAIVTINQHLENPEEPISAHGRISYLDENIPQVYEDGKEEGKQAERSDFWDIFQNNGTKKSYRMVFFNWKGEIYNPKYPVITISQNSQAYYFYTGGDTKVPIIVKGGTSQFFTSSKLVSIPLLDVDETTDLCDATGRVNYHTFGSCSSLKNISFSGVIGKNLWISSSPLTKDSILGIKVTYSEIEVGKILQTDYSNFGFRVDSHITNDSGDVTSIVVTPVQSEEQYATYPISKLDEISVTFNLVKIGENYYWGGIFGALKDYSADTSGTQHTLTLGTTNEEKLSDAEMAIATQKGWTVTQ